MQTLYVETELRCSPSWIEQARKQVVYQAVDILSEDKEAHELFHNHQGDKSVRRYPSIQYRSKRNKLIIFAMGEAVSALLKVITNADPERSSHIIHLNNVKMKKGRSEFTKSNGQEYYRLFDWIAFNNETYNEKWQQSYTLLERVTLLNQAITGHLRCVAEKFMTREEIEDIVGELYMLTARKNQQVYGNNMLGFNVIFKTPYILPEHFGLGRCVSLGAGTFQKLKVNPEVGKKKTKEKAGKEKIKTTKNKKDSGDEKTTNIIDDVGNSKKGEKRSETTIEQLIEPILNGKLN